MIMVNAASPATLDRYADGIRYLARIHPNAWGIISLAEELNRFERWDQISEDLFDGPEKDREAVSFSESDRPWNVVIRLSMFGQTNSYSHWWFLHVLSVATSGSRSATAAMLEGSDKLPEFQGGSGRRGGAQAAKKTRGFQATSSSNGTNRRKQGVCFNWNKGACSTGFTCTQGFTHECRECRGPHRAVDCPTAKPKGNGKGKKGNGKKGSKGSSKGSKNSSGL